MLDERPIKAKATSRGRFFSLSQELLLLGGCAFVLAWVTDSHFRPWLSFESESLALAGLLLALFGACAGSKPLQVPAPFFLLLALSASPWLQWLFGLTPYVGDAVMSSYYLMALAVGFALGWQVRAPVAESHVVMPRRIASLDLVMCVAIAAAFVSASVGLSQWLSVTDALGGWVMEVQPGSRPIGNVGQPNHLGTILLVGLVFTVLAYELKRLRGLPALLLIVLLSLVLALAQSRTAVLNAVLISSVLVVWAALGADFRRVRLWQISIWLGLLLSSFYWVPWLGAWIGVGGARGGDLGHTEDRVTLWLQAVEAIRLSPWFGYGWNQFAAAQAAGAVAHPAAMFSVYAHNLFLDIVAWVGVPLGLVLIAMIVYWFISRFVSLKTAPGRACMLGLIAISVHALLEYPVAYSYFLVVAAVLAGVVEADARPQARTWRFPKPFALVGAVFALLVGAVVVRDYLHAEEDFRVVQFESFKVGQTPPDYQPPRLMLLTQLQMLLDAARVEVRPGMSDTEHLLLADASSRFQYSALQHRYAVSLAFRGEIKQALSVLRTLRSVYGERHYKQIEKALRLSADAFPQIAPLLAEPTKLGTDVNYSTR